MTKEYLKMADMFHNEMHVIGDSNNMIADDIGIIIGCYSGDQMAAHVLHAINSHDELVHMLAVMTELVGKINCYCHLSGLSAKANSGNPVESWMAEADEALDAIRSAT